MNCSDYIEWKSIKTNMCSGAIPAVCYMCPSVGDSGSGNTNTSTGGDPSQWSRYPALQDISMANFSLNNVQNLTGNNLTLRSTGGNLYLSSAADIVPNAPINFNNINNALNIHNINSGSATGIILNSITGTANAYGMIMTNINSTINESDGIIINTINSSSRAYGINVFNITGVTQANGIYMESITGSNGVNGLYMSNLTSSNSSTTGISINTIKSRNTGSGLKIDSIDSTGPSYGTYMNSIKSSDNTAEGVFIQNINGANSMGLNILTIDSTSFSYGININSVNSETDTTGLKILRLNSRAGSTNGILLDTIASEQDIVRGIYINDVASSTSNSIGMEVNNVRSIERNDCIGIKIDNINSELGSVGLQIGSNISAKDPAMVCKAIEQIGINNPNIYNEFQSRMIIGTGEAGNSIDINEPYGALSIYGSAKYTAKHFNSDRDGTRWDISRNTGNLYSFISSDNQLTILLPTDAQNGTFFKFMNINGSITKIDGNNININNVASFDWIPSRRYVSCDIWYSSDLGEWITNAEMA